MFTAQGTEHFHLDEGQERMVVRDRMSRLCHMSPFAHSYLVYTLLHLLCPRKLTCVNYNGRVLGLPLRSGDGKTLLQRSEGGRRRWMGYLFLWFSPCRVTLGQLCPPSKGHWSSPVGSLYTTLCFPVL